jgi:tetratricopeptide (TPR) repeat protein
VSDIQDNPFEPNPPDEAKELSTLIRAIEFARRFSLLIVRCNEPITRERLIREIKTQLPDLNIEVVHFDRPIRHLLDELRARPESNPGVIFVTGLEHSMERDAPEKSPFIVNLNHSRNGFGKFVHCPLVLWLPEFVVNAVAHGAPDFFSVRSGLYYFIATPDAARPMIEQHLSPEIYETYSMPLDEKRERIASIENLLNDFRTLPEANRNAGEEADLLRRLGILHESIGELDEAEAIYREAVQLAERSGDERLRARCFGKVADIFYRRGDLDHALRILQVELLPVFEKLGDLRSRAVTVGKIADIFYSRGDLDEALRIRQEEELPVFEKLGDVRSRAVAMGRVADILETRGDLDEALRIRQEEVIPVYEKLGDVSSRAMTMGQVAGNLYRRGDLDEALRILQVELLPIFEKLGDVRSGAVTMGQIASILYRRGDLDEALRIFQVELLPIFEKLGDVRSGAVTLTKIGQLLLSLREFGRAREFFEESLALFEKMKLPEAKTVEKMLQVLENAEKNAQISPQTSK